MEVNINNISNVQSGTSTMKTVLETLANYASSQPDQKVWSFLNDSGEHVTDSYSYSELESSTTELANQLKTLHKLKNGDRALLVFFPGLAFTAALIACFKAGIIAVPVFPPDPRKLQKDLDHFISIQTSSQAKIVLTHTLYNYAKKVTDLQRMFNTKKSIHQWPTALQWIVVEDILSRAKTNKLPANINTSAPSSSTAGASIVNLNDIAFLQYTSGSTSEPKGVMISHANLAHNLTLITKELVVDTSTINVSWLPQYHDMGLIGSYLGTLYCGGTGYYLSPISFLKDPNVWLKAVSKYRGSHTQAPNFAFALAARKFTDYCKQHNSSSSSEIQLDLSCVKHMINAAEPVDVAAIHHFYTVFGKYGLQKGVVVPTYGLAEHTVFVCSDGQTVLTLNKESLENGTVEIVSQKLLKDCENTDINEHDGNNNNNQQQQQPRTQMIVGCGLPEKGESVVIKIVDPVTLVRVDDGKVGEIWVTSPSKAQGYWNQPGLTQDAFFAHITSSSSATSGGDAATANKAVVDVGTAEDTKSAINTTDSKVIDDTNGYLRTGDMGFLYHKELFICGRIKDLIIIRGSNHYPQDIEKTAENASNLLRQGCSAAFAIQHESAHTEAVVFVAELKQNVPKTEYEKTVQAIRNTVNKEHGISLTCVCLLEPKTVIKTTSGKISRAGCRKAYQNQSLQILHKWEGNINDNNNVSDDELSTVLPPDDLEGAENNDDGNNANKNNSPNKKGGAKPLQLPKLTKQQVRELELTEIAALLETTLVSVSSQGPSPLTAPIDAHASLISLGLDSFTVVQFKGVLDKRFHCTDISDEFLFTNGATLEELSKAVKHGSLTMEQRSQFDGVGGGGTTGGGTGQHSSSTYREVTTDVNGNEFVNKTAAATTVIEQRTPLCPWFTCCY